MIDTTFKEFVRYEQAEPAGYAPVLLDAAGNPLHDKELCHSILYRRAFDGPLSVLAKYAGRAVGLGIAGELVVSVRTEKPVEDWDRQPRPFEAAQTVLPVIRPIVSFANDDGSVTYLFGNGGGGCMLHGERTIDTPEGRFVVTANASTRGVCPVPGNPDLWRWPLIQNGRRGRLDRLPDFIAAAYAEPVVGCTPDTSGSAA